MLATLFILAGVITSISACVLYLTLKNAPDGHEDTGGFHIEQKSKPGIPEAKLSKSGKQHGGAAAGKVHLDVV